MLGPVERAAAAVSEGWSGAATLGRDSNSDCEALSQRSALGIFRPCFPRKASGTFYSSFASEVQFRSCLPSSLLPPIFPLLLSRGDAVTLADG